MVPGHATGPLPPHTSLCCFWVRRKRPESAAPAPGPPVSLTYQQRSPGSRAGPGAAGAGTESAPEEEPRGDQSRELQCRDRNPRRGAGQDQLEGTPRLEPGPVLRFPFGKGKRPSIFLQRGSLHSQPFPPCRSLPTGSPKPLPRPGSHSRGAGVGDPSPSPHHNT